MNDQIRTRKMTASEIIHRAAKASRRMTIDERWALIVASQQASENENTRSCGAKKPEEAS